MRLKVLDNPSPEPPLNPSLSDVHVDTSGVAVCLIRGIHDHRSVGVQENRSLQHLPLQWRQDYNRRTGSLGVLFDRRNGD